MKFVFGDYTLDPAARQLLRGGRAVPLEPKMYELLEILMKRRPAVVANDELDELLWPHVYVARTSLTRLVSELRSVLGDTPRDSFIIRTAYKIGYAFCAEVTTSEVAPARPPATGIHLIWSDRIIPLGEGEHMVGRGAECSIVIDANTVSRRHARIVVRGSTVTIEDLESTNGTHVNGVRIEAPTLLSIGNRLELGSEVVLLGGRNCSALTVRIEGRSSVAAHPSGNDNRAGIHSI